MAKLSKNKAIEGLAYLQRLDVRLRTREEHLGASEMIRECVLRCVLIVNHVCLFIVQELALRSLHLSLQVSMDVQHVS